MLLPSLRVLVCLIAAGALSSAERQPAATQDFLRIADSPGKIGGRLVVGQSAEPKTLNPVMATDIPSRDVIRCTTADLIHINRATLKTEPALAKSWTISRDGSQFTLQLRRGLQFSDGAPFDADDVIFSFKVYMDEKVGSPQRDLLMVNGKPLVVEKLGPYSVRFTFPGPYAVGERMFDSLAMLPRHLLEKDYQEGKIAQAWNLSSPPDRIAGLGPFRVKQVVAGERVVLERNPYYWKLDSKGQNLPYLDELTFLIVSSRDAQVVRFQAGETQVLSPLSADNFAALEPGHTAGHYKLFDVGPGLEYNFLLFNLNDDAESKLPEVARKQKWFKDARFRHAVSLAVDRAAIVRLVYRGRGSALATNVTPGDKLWFDPSIPAPERSLPKARELLKSAGFSWKADGALVDPAGQPVDFSIITSATNAQRSQMATLIQDDLKQIGMKVHVVPLEFRSLVERITRSHDYEAAIMGLLSGDADPNPDLPVLVSSGAQHYWRLGEKAPDTPWQAEIDRLMEKQIVTMDYRQRRKIYDRVQQILAQEEPVVFLASPHILAVAREGLGNVHPAIMDNYILWNADELFWQSPAGKH